MVEWIQKYSGNKQPLGAGTAMKESIKRYYFAIIKFCCIITLIIYYLYSSEKSLHEKSLEWFLLAVMVLISVGYELVNEAPEDSEGFFGLFGSKTGRKKLLLLCAEAILTLVLLVFFRGSNNGLFLLPIVILDAITLLRFPFYCGALILFGIFFSTDNFFLYVFYSVFILIIYLQNYVIIGKYRKYLEDYEEEEYRLKDSLHSKDILHKEELEKSSLLFENKMLEEKARLSQALHDKLGHSINGSIYQLEACKVLAEKAPQESGKLVQGVIDNLRTSMDEIRLLLRREKPDRKRMAMIQLIGLCEECREKYGIQAEVKVEGEDKAIPESLWEIILDNTFEAVTNALKYAKCTRLMIEIAILHKVVRCSITDNGIGCGNIKKGMGLQGMAERMRRVNGLLDVSSENGFRINMIIPIGEKPE
jgi:signal transduction histidine kinase